MICTSLANRFTSDPNIVIHSKKYIILFLTRYLMSWTHNFTEKYRSLISLLSWRRVWLSIVTSPHLICDVTRTRGTGIVTSYASIVLPRATWRQGNLHWWATVNVGFSSPPDIHGLACKNMASKYINSRVINADQKCLLLVKIMHFQALQFGHRCSSDL